MKRHSGSILLKLQIGFALATLVLAMLLALFMDGALRSSLEAEDAHVLEGQARELVQRLSSGRTLADADGIFRPEKAAWRVLDTQGRTLSESADWAAIPAVPRPLTGSPVEEWEAPGGRMFSVVVRGWSGGSLILVMDRTHEGILIRDFRHTLAMGVLLAALAAAMLARGIARWGLAPLGHIVQEAESISVRNLDRRLITEHFPHELQELVITLNGTFSRLEAAFDRVGNLGAELAHELRTPLQNLRSTLENRALRTGCAEEEASALGGLIEECDRMAALIEQILFVARTDQLPAGLVLKPISIADLLEEVRDFYEARAEEARVTLRVEAGSGGQVEGERLLLTRALHNLTANALDHVAEGGEVRLGASAEPDATELWVADDGTGIPAEWVARLGTPFVRPPGARKPGGLGLGLAIVRRIATMLGGTLKIESRQNEGTRVTLRFPHRHPHNSD